MSSSFGLCTIGNAIVDIITPTNDEFLASQEYSGMRKGGMTLIDSDRAKELYSLISDVTESSGGSAGNTMAAFASFGGTGAYIGKVANDALGKVFSSDLHKMNVHFNSHPLNDGTPTAQCIILVSDDAQRTMNTFLGACVKLTCDDIDESIIANSEVTYLEGYLFDSEEAKKAFYKAAKIAEDNNKKLSLTLSDAFCVNRHRADFLNLVKNHVDILFANHEEIVSLYQTDNLDQAIALAKNDCDIVAITDGANGSIILHDNNIIKIPAVKPKALIDTTGAGDAYAAGFLFGYTNNKSLEECGRLGSISASEIISHFGPRPQSSLKNLL